MSTILGFIGFGEAAYCISKGLKAQEFEQIYAYDVVLEQRDAMSETVSLIQRRAGESGVELVASLADLINLCNIVVSSVPASFANEVAQRVLDLGCGQCELFVDVTTSIPGDKEAMSERFNQQGIAYADSAMMGSLPQYGHKVPMLVSGNGAEQWINTMKPYGMAMQLVGQKAGRSTTLKLIRSVFMKGLEALAIETLMSARKAGIEKEILESITKSVEDGGGFRQMLNRMVTSNVIHSRRRSMEAQESGTLLEAQGLDAQMTEATAKKLLWLAKLGLNETKADFSCKTLEDAFKLWESKGILTNKSS